MSEASDTVKTQPGTRTLTGSVVSDRRDKTITVLVERSVKHPVYGKILRRRSKIHAHDEHNECRVGDKVTIVETRPISKQKSWRLLARSATSRRVDESGGAEPTAADEAPATDEATAAEETPAATEASAAEEAPAATEAPAAEEAPAATEASAAEEAPAATEASAAEEAPAATEAPAAEEAPAAKESST